MRADGSGATSAPPVPANAGAAGTLPGYRYYVLGVLFLVAVFNLMDRQILSILQESVKETFHLSDLQLGLLHWCFTSSFIALGLPLARFGDRRGRRSIVAACLVLWSVMTACCGLAQNFRQLALARLGVGAGEAGASPMVHSLIADYFEPKRRASANALYSIGVPVGIMFGIAAGGILKEHFDWRTAFFLVGLPGTALALVVRLTVREPPRGFSERFVDSGRTPPWREVIRHLSSVRSYRNTVIAVALQSITWYGIYQWSPSFFKRSHGLTEGRAGIELGLLFGTSGILGMLGAGTLADHLSRKDRRWYLWLCMTGALIQVPLIAAALLVDSKSEALALLFVPMLVGSLFTVVPVTVVQGLAPPRMRATADAIRIFFAMSLVGQALGASMIGLLSHALEPRFGHHSLRYALLGVIVLANALAVGYYGTAACTVAADLDAATALSAAGAPGLVRKVTPSGPAG